MFLSRSAPSGLIYIIFYLLLNFIRRLYNDRQRKSIGEVRGIRRTLVQEFTNEADAFSD